jgi:hypothetical protein
MIVRSSQTSPLLITQPDHAALAARIMQHWSADGLPASPRRREILLAIAEHDNGWREVDASPILDPSTGQVLDFVHIPNDVKRGIWPRGVARLADAPYAAALVAQHALHVYRRYRAEPDWASFFEEMAVARDRHLARETTATLDDLLRDYLFLRIGDLMSLTFCNAWTEPDADGWAYRVRLDGSRLLVSPDPFAGRSIPIEITARTLDSAETVIVRGIVSGG